MKISQCRSARVGLRPRVFPPLHPQSTCFNNVSVVLFRPCLPLPSQPLLLLSLPPLSICSRLVRSLVLRSSMVSFLLSLSPSFMCASRAPHPRGLAAQVRYCRIRYVCFLLVSWLYCILWSLPSRWSTPELLASEDYFTTPNLLCRSSPGSLRWGRQLLVSTPLALTPPLPSRWCDAIVGGAICSLSPPFPFVHAVEF